jgi:hypothetical protein
VKRVLAHHEQLEKKKDPNIRALGSSRRLDGIERNCIWKIALGKAMNRNLVDPRRGPQSGNEDALDLAIIYHPTAARPPQSSSVEQ